MCSLTDSSTSSSVKYIFTAAAPAVTDYCRSVTATILAVACSIRLSQSIIYDDIHLTLVHHLSRRLCDSVGQQALYDGIHVTLVHYSLIT